VENLRPDRWYFYRFHAGDEVSPVGRARTFPRVEDQSARLRFAFASCQHYEQGLYTAYEHMAQTTMNSTTTARGVFQSCPTSRPKTF
jgi:alkaline phosphatase D